MQQGLVNKRPNQRADYTDYYLLNKPAKFMVHDLLVIEEEYMSKYVGCCVNVKEHTLRTQQSLAPFSNQKK
jgi:hypothetical protein